VWWEITCASTKDEFVLQVIDCSVYVTVLGILAFVWLKIEWQSLFMSV